MLTKRQTQKDVISGRERWGGEMEMARRLKMDHQLLRATIAWNPYHPEHNNNSRTLIWRKIAAELNDRMCGPTGEPSIYRSRVSHLLLVRERAVNPAPTRTRYLGLDEGYRIRAELIDEVVKLRHMTVTEANYSFSCSPMELPCEEDGCATPSAMLRDESSVIKWHKLVQGMSLTLPW